MDLPMWIPRRRKKVSGWIRSYWRFYSKICHYMVFIVDFDFLINVNGRKSATLTYCGCWKCPTGSFMHRFISPHFQYSTILLVTWNLRRVWTAPSSGESKGSSCKDSRHTDPESSGRVRQPLPQWNVRYIRMTKAMNIRRRNTAPTAPDLQLFPAAFLIGKVLTKVSRIWPYRNGVRPWHWCICPGMCRNAASVCAPL